MFENCDCSFKEPTERVGNQVSTHLCQIFRIHISVKYVRNYLEPLKKDLLKKLLVAVQLGKGLKKNFLYAHSVGPHRCSSGVVQ
jgi:hypothetical protein